ncbi:multiple coagulation factor deficiency protein 2 homolog [Procambarus clarkii]|uniref:multiple coagulation factor deficiency protein 2 homolog n=1 Tax=Procambarus clarkii TaxID=6728 RepID=UPI001E6774DC|nr:multiple coagulation factor deficiency protein 2 homolog [Procambarus clarkii]
MRHWGVWLVVGVWAGCGLDVVAIEAGQKPMHINKPSHHQHVKQHHHHVPKRPQDTLGNPKLLQDDNLLHDREHLKEELPAYMSLDKIDQMSDKELDFHYFKLHDFDNNYGLDGLELLSAIIHIAGDTDGDEDEVTIDDEKLKGLSEQEKKILQNFRQQKWDEKFKFYIELVDDVLQENDNNKDGYLSWGEFRLARNHRR